jgi:hypothetical protein
MKKYLYGVKYAILSDLTSQKPLGIFEVIGGIEISREIEQLLLEGGHYDGAFAVEAGQPSNGITATLKEYPNFAYSQFENAEITESTSETLGYIGALANTVGTTAFSAVTGVASVAITTDKGADIPAGQIVLEALTATTAKVYLNGDVASGRTPIVDELPVIAETITITDAGTIALADYGITFTGGSAVDMEIGDMMTFDVRPANSISTSIKVGKNAGVNYFGLHLVYPRNSEGEQTIIRFPKVAAVGMSFNANSREFSEFEQPMTPLLGDSEKIVYEIIRTKVS